MKKQNILSTTFVLMFSIAAILAGCGGSADGGGKNEQKTLTVANWKGYGSDSPYGADEFEELCDCKVVHQYYNSSEELLNMLREGGIGEIDVILTNPLYIDVAIDEGLIQPIDTAKIESYDDLLEDFRDSEDIKDEDGNIYSVPWTWGTTALGYNPEIVADEPSSWSELWDDKYEGKVGFFDDYFTAIATTALYLEEPDPYHPDLDKVKEALLDLKGNTKTYWSSYDDWFKAYGAEEVVIGNLWSGAATQLLTAGDPIEYIYPDEGAVGWSDYWNIVTDSPNEELAYDWINFMVGEDFQQNFSTDDESANSPINQKVIDGLTDDEQKMLWIYPDVPENLVIQGPQEDDVRQEWLELWNDIKVGQ